MFLVNPSALKKRLTLSGKLVLPTGGRANSTHSDQVLSLPTDRARKNHAGRHRKASTPPRNTFQSS